MSNICLNNRIQHLIENSIFIIFKTHLEFTIFFGMVSLSLFWYLSPIILLNLALHNHNLKTQVCFERSKQRKYVAPFCASKKIKTIKHRKFYVYPIDYRPHLAYLWRRFIFIHSYFIDSESTCVGWAPRWRCRRGCLFYYLDSAYTASLPHCCL